MAKPERLTSLFDIAAKFPERPGFRVDRKVMGKLVAPIGALNMPQPDSAPEYDR